MAIKLADLGKMKAKSGALNMELDALKKKLIATNKERDELKLKFKTDGGKLQATIAALKKATMPQANANLPKLDLPMLVNDASTLDGRFLSVFKGLNRVKGGPDGREKVYAELTEDEKSRDIHLVPFDVGLSAVAGKEEQELKTAVNNMDKSSRFLVVGYASTDGDAASDRKISSERASNVAQKITAVPGVPQDQVKVIYFGQANQFNAKYLSPNRVVEVWRLK